LEPASDNREPTVADLYSSCEEPIAKLQNARSSQEFLDLAVHRIRAFTGFDRVMAYKCLHDGLARVRSVLNQVIEGQTYILGNTSRLRDVPSTGETNFLLELSYVINPTSNIFVPLVPENIPSPAGHWI